ncbi:unnamed protein product [Amoebophrya sp. A25]|nr:unnamed protein product [Amoebophrya sp. A25]|eukprot:GSA25T00014033001.1
MGFTGIVQEIGRVREVQKEKAAKLWDGSVGKSHTFTIEASAEILNEKTYVGESICTEGVCLTVTAFNRPASATEKGWFQVQAAGHTLDITMLGELVADSPVNLEKAVCVGQDISGHEVQGHVDCTVEIIKKWQDRDNLRLRFRLPQQLRSLIVMKGYVALGGASLTVCNITRDTFEVMLIPHTVQRITLARRAVGDRVNVEAHVIGKYILTQMDVALERERFLARLALGTSLVALLTAAGAMVLTANSRLSGASR